MVKNIEQVIYTKTKEQAHRRVYTLQIACPQTNTLFIRPITFFAQYFYCLTNSLI